MLEGLLCRCQVLPSRPAPARCTLARAPGLHAGIYPPRSRRCQARRPRHLAARRPPGAGVALPGSAGVAEVSVTAANPLSSGGAGRRLLQGASSCTAQGDRWSCESSGRYVVVQGGGDSMTVGPSPPLACSAERGYYLHRVPAAAAGCFAATPIPGVPVCCWDACGPG